jgi:hypothetical protein
MSRILAVTLVGIWPVFACLEPCQEDGDCGENLRCITDDGSKFCGKEGEGELAEGEGDASEGEGEGDPSEGEGEGEGEYPTIVFSTEVTELASTFGSNIPVEIFASVNNYDPSWNCAVNSLSLSSEKVSVAVVSSDVQFSGVCSRDGEELRKTLSVQIAFIEMPVPVTVGNSSSETLSIAGAHLSGCNVYDVSLPQLPFATCDGEDAQTVTCEMPSLTSAPPANSYQVRCASFGQPELTTPVSTRYLSAVFSVPTLVPDGAITAGTFTCVTEPPIGATPPALPASVTNDQALAFCTSSGAESRSSQAITFFGLDSFNLVDRPADLGRVNIAFDPLPAGWECQPRLRGVSDCLISLDSNPIALDGRNGCRDAFAKSQLAFICRLNDVDQFIFGEQNSDLMTIDWDDADAESMLNLVYVEGRITTSNLVVLNGDKLKAVGGDFSAVGNAQNSTLSLPRLTSVGRDLKIESNLLLNSDGSLSVTSNGALTSFAAPSLASVGVNVVIGGNPNTNPMLGTLDICSTASCGVLAVTGVILVDNRSASLTCDEVTAVFCPSDNMDDELRGLVGVSANSDCPCQ